MFENQVINIGIGQGEGKKCSFLWLFVKGSESLFPSLFIVKVYFSLIQSILEYAVPAWTNIPLYLEDAMESIQKRALAVIFPGVPYDEALRIAGVTTLTARRDHVCKSFIRNIKTSGFLSNLLPTITEVSHGYTLRSGQIRYDKVLANTSRLNNFVTYKFQWLFYLLTAHVIQSPDCNMS